MQNPQSAEEPADHLQFVDRQLMFQMKISIPLTLSVLQTRAPISYIGLRVAAYCAQRKLFVVYVFEFSGSRKARRPANDHSERSELFLKVLTRWWAPNKQVPIHILKVTGRLRISILFGRPVRSGMFAPLRHPLPAPLLRVGRGFNSEKVLFESNSRSLPAWVDLVSAY